MYVNEACPVCFVRSTFHFTLLCMYVYVLSVLQAPLYLYTLAMTAVYKLTSILHLNVYIINRYIAGMNSLF